MRSQGGSAADRKKFIDMADKFVGQHPPCSNCDSQPSVAQGRCRTCYQYFRRHKEERPRHLIDAKAEGLAPGELTTVYRLFSEDLRLLYVGITGHGLQRLHQHHRSKEWWDTVWFARFEHFPSRRAAEVAEALAILREKPVYNISSGIQRRFSKDPMANKLARPEIYARLRKRLQGD